MSIYHKNLMSRENTGNNYPVLFAIYQAIVLAQAVFVKNIKEFSNKFSINNQRIRQR